MSDVRTRWHNFMDAIEAGRITIHVGKHTVKHHTYFPSFKVDRLKSLLQTMDGVPSYFFTREAMDAVAEDSTTKTIEALQQFSLDKLPHKLQMVEFATNSRDNIRHFCFVMERDGLMPDDGEKLYHPFTTIMFSLYEPDAIKNVNNGRFDNKPYAVCYPIYTHVQNIGANHPAMSDPLIEDERPEDERGSPRKAGVHYYFVPMPYISSPDLTPEVCDAAAAYLCHHIGGPQRGLIAMLRTQGVERDTITVPKLNKARTKSGKRVIPDHTVVRFGHYYTRSGGRKAIDPNAPKGTVRMHVRSAHTRMQPHGPGNKERKLVLVEACLVNYDPASGEAPPVAKRKVVKA